MKKIILKGNRKYRYLIIIIKVNCERKKIKKDKKFDFEKKISIK